MIIGNTQNAQLHIYLVMGRPSGTQNVKFVFAPAVKHESIDILN